MIQWENLQNIWWFIGAAILIALAWYHYLSRNRLAALLNKQGNLLRHFSPTRTIIKAILGSVGILFLFIALFHPKWGRIEERVEQHGRDLFVALDTSRSMLAQDVKPDRLTCAKNIIKRVMDKLDSERVSLMVFSERARVYCPLTKDQELVSLFLDQIDHTTIGAGTTLLDQPIQLAIDQCNRVPERKNRLLLLVTDGEDFSQSLSKLQKKAKDAGLTILVVGVGTKQGAPVPLYTELGKRRGYIKDKKDQVVISQLNDAALRSVAEATGGSVIFAQQEQVNINSLVQKIEQFEKETQGEKAVSSLQEQYPWFLLVSFICFLLEWLL